jgi:hypothetical protein
MKRVSPSIKKHPKPLRREGAAKVIAEAASTADRALEPTCLAVP